jgi:urease accessory protein
MNAVVHLPDGACQEIKPGFPSWKAYLRLSFAKRKRGVRLVESAHEGPLYVQKAFYPEGDHCAHCYLLHPPGGLVTGDHLTISITSQEDAHALITTPGAGRIYKAREQGGIQTQTIQLKVEQNACLEWLPQETILFPNSQARLNTRIDLAENAKVIAWDIICFGLPANKLQFTEGSIKQRLQVWSKDRIKLNERLVIDLPSDAFEKPLTILNGNAGLRSMPVHGLLVSGPFHADQCTALIDALRQLSPSVRIKKALVAVSLNGEFLTVRYLGHCTEAARLYFTEAWKLIRPALIKKEAVSPRIWAT